MEGNNIYVYSGNHWIGPNHWTNCIFKRTKIRRLKDNFELQIYGLLLSKEIKLQQDIIITPVKFFNRYRCKLSLNRAFLLDVLLK